VFERGHKLFVGLLEFGLGRKMRHGGLDLQWHEYKDGERSVCCFKIHVQLFAEHDSGTT
jgi:hypothetical protein